MIARKIGFVGLLLVAAVLVQDASATLTSSLYYGSTFYSTDDGLSGYIDFAVYDSREEYETLYGLTAPGTGDYVYAYQIFHDAGVNPPLAYFAILGIEGAPVDGIDCHDDSSSGIDSTDEYFTLSEGVWEFQNELGEGILIAGEHSWFLVLSSQTSWVKGDFEIRPAESWVPVPDIPEPCTLTLFALSGAVMLIRRKKLVR